MAWSIFMNQSKKSKYNTIIRIMLVLSIVSAFGCSTTKITTPIIDESQKTYIKYSLNGTDITGQTVNQTVESGSGVTINYSITGPKANDILVYWNKRYSGPYRFTSLPQETNNSIYTTGESGTITLHGFPSRTQSINGVDMIVGKVTVNITFE